MRACFLGQNITALGNGFAKLQTPPPQIPDAPQPEGEKGKGNEDDCKASTPSLHHQN